MKALRVGLLFLACQLILNHNAFSQLVFPEADVAASVDAGRTLYAEAFPVHPQLYNGPEYIDYSKGYHELTGHQFFLLPKKQAGSAFYNGHDFSNLQLAYDLVLDQVVISPPQSPLALRLVNENVRGFTIAGHRFTRLVADSAKKSVIRTGFYEVLLDSTVQVLAKRTKRLQERLVQRFVDAAFISKDAVYLKKGGVYYAVGRKATAMRMFSDRSKEIQNYLKTHPLSFKKDKFEPSLVQLASYYSGLPPR
jgi:hypothetical protein